MGQSERGDRLGEGHTVSTIWSCLAAHAAVLHIDGIERRALPESTSACSIAAAADHPMTEDFPEPRWCRIRATTILPEAALLRPAIRS